MSTLSDLQDIVANLATEVRADSVSPARVAGILDAILGYIHDSRIISEADLKQYIANRIDEIKLNGPGSGSPDLSAFSLMTEQEGQKIIEDKFLPEE